MAELEYRALETPGAVTTKPLARGGMIVEGYAALFDHRSSDLGGFVERIHRGAFARSLQSGRDIVSNFNHDRHRLLGRTAASTLHVAEDRTGLHYRLTLPDTSDGRDVAELVERGDITGSSFSFKPVRHHWGETETGYPEKHLDVVDLYEVGPVVTPAYPKASVTVTK